MNNSAVFREHLVPVTALLPLCHLDEHRSHRDVRDLRHQISLDHQCRALDFSVADLLQTPHHSHSHGEEVRRIDTGHGVVALEVFEDGVPPRWRLRSERGPHWAAEDVTVETLRPDGQRQSFGFVDRGGYLESTTDIPEPHEFTARLSLSHGNHAHDYEVVFAEQGDGHEQEPLAPGAFATTDGYQDAHELSLIHI